MTQKNIPLAEMCVRYKKLYTAAIYDLLETKFGYPNQVLDTAIQPLTRNMKIAGPAFTIKGEPSAKPFDPVNYIGNEVVGKLSPYCVAIYATGHDRICAQWGGHYSALAKANGCQGVVTDGGLRDCTHIVELNFPAFCRYRTPTDQRNRWQVTESQVPIFVSGSLQENVPVNPGDFVFGDWTGVLIIPRDIVVDVLLRAEELSAGERKLTENIKKGASLNELYEKYAKL